MGCGEPDAGCHQDDYRQKNSGGDHSMARSQLSRLAGLTGPEDAEERLSVVPEDGHHGSEDHRRRAGCTPGDEEENVDHENVRDHGQHHGRTQQRRLSEEKQRRAGELDQSEEGGVDVGVAVEVPNEITPAQGSNCPEGQLRWDAELSAKELARSVQQEQEGREISEPVQILRIRIAGCSHGFAPFEECHDPCQPAPPRRRIVANRSTNRSTDMELSLSLKYRR